MNWLELLLVVVFFGAPLLGRILQRNAPQPPPTVPPADAEREDIQWLPAPAQGRGSLPAPAKAESGWSAGWGEWGEVEAAPEEGEDEEGADAPWDAESIHTREAISLEPVTLEEAALRPLPAAPVALDVEVDRRQEHVRFHDRYLKPAPRRRSPDRLADHLRSRREVRRAVLLAEVLGPPRSLREIQEDR